MIEQGLETLWYVDRHRMFQKHPMSFWQGQALFVPGAFHRTRGFPDIGCLADIRCLTKMTSVWGNEIGFRIMIFRRVRKIIPPYN